SSARVDEHCGSFGLKEPRLRGGEFLCGSECRIAREVSLTTRPRLRRIRQSKQLFFIQTRAWRVEVSSHLAHRRSQHDLAIELAFELFQIRFRLCVYINDFRREWARKTRRPRFRIRD